MSTPLDDDHAGPRAAAAPAGPVKDAGGFIAARDAAHRRRHMIGFFFMVVGMFMAILDIQIVASSLNEIRAGLSAAPDEISWVQSSYLIAEVVVIPLSGWLSQVFSTRWLFVTSSIGFTLASVACAFAWDIESMITFRVLQGLFGGIIMPTVFATSYVLLGGNRSTKASMLMGLIATSGSTLGPSLGGWITSTFSWHWLFLINLAPGIAVTLAVAALIDIDEPNWGLLKGFDLPGILSVAIFLGSLQFILEEGAKKDWLQSDLILTFGLVAVMSGVFFFWRELTCARPVISLRVFRYRNFSIGCVVAFCIGVGMYGSVYLLPVFLSQVSRYDAMQIGTVMTVMGIFQMAGAPLTGVLVERIGLRTTLALGVSLFAAGVYLNGFFTFESGFGDMALPQALRGVGVMLCMITTNAFALGVIPIQEIKLASGVFSLMRNLGGAFGLAVINTMLSARMDFHTSRLADGINPASPAARDMLDGMAEHLGDLHGGIMDAEASTLQMIYGLVQREAMVLSFGDITLLMAGLFVLVLALVPFVRPLPPLPAPALATVAKEAH